MEAKRGWKWLSGILAALLLAVSAALGCAIVDGRAQQIHAESAESALALLNTRAQVNFFAMRLASLKKDCGTLNLVAEQLCLRKAIEIAHYEASDFAQSLLTGKGVKPPTKYM